MFRIAKTLTISCSHQLHGLPEAHPCSRLHGHNYTVQVMVLSPSVDKVGMVVDYGIIGEVVKKLDHRHLNDVIEQPTAENVARYLYYMLIEAIPRVGVTIRVLVKETENTEAEYWE